MVALSGRIWPPPSPTGVGAPGRPAGVCVRVYVTVDSASMFSGYGDRRSMNDREASMVVAPSRWRALNSGTSVVKSRVTSITGAPSLANAATGKLIMMVLLLDAFTDRKSV